MATVCEMRVLQCEHALAPGMTREFGVKRPFYDEAPPSGTARDGITRHVGQISIWPSDAVCGARTAGCTLLKTACTLVRGIIPRENLTLFSACLNGEQPARCPIIRREARAVRLRACSFKRARIAV